MVWRKSCGRRDVTDRGRDRGSGILYADTCLFDDCSHGTGHYPKSFASLRRIEEILEAEIEIKEETIKQLLNHPLLRQMQLLLNMSHSNILKLLIQF